jgi:hypothetical protein
MLLPLTPFGAGRVRPAARAFYPALACMSRLISSRPGDEAPILRTSLMALVRRQIQRNAAESARSRRA